MIQGFTVSFARLALAAIFVFSNISFAQENRSEDWNPELEIPKMEIVGATSTELENMAVAYRKELVQTLDFWRLKGLPNPPDLQGLFFISDIENITVLDVLKKLNPEIPNMQEHLETQFRHLQNSALLKFVLFADQKLGLGSFVKERVDIHWIFDKYAMVRYGFNVNHTYEHALKGSTIQQAIQVSGTPDALARDNAFYGQFPRLDLTEVLPLADGKTEENMKVILDEASTDQQKKLGMQGIINDKLLKEKMKNPETLSRRIVILPRTHESLENNAVSTLRDRTVGIHELGHHINHSIKKPGTNVDRIIDEVFADYMTVATLDDPKIGDFFAKASGMIAERIRAQEKLNPDEQKMARAYEKIAERGYLRDLSQFEDIDHLNRHNRLSNDYDSGQPVRNFLWSLRNDSELTKDSVDRIALQVIPEFSDLPVLVTKRTHFLLQIRNAILEWSYQNKVSKELKKTLEARFLPVNELLGKNGKVSVKVSIPDDKTVKADVEIHWNPKLGSQEATELIAQIGDLLKDVSLDLSQERIQIESDINAKFSKEEAQEEAWVRRHRKLGFGISDGVRPMIKADYVLPEFFRAYYRVAQNQSPEIAERVRSHAERAMNAKSIVVPMENGRAELVFVANSHAKLNPVSHIRIPQILRNLASLRSEYNRLNQIEASVPEEQEKVAQELELVQKKYGRELEKIQEYERTGRMRKLFIAHPFLDMTEKAGLFLAKKIGKFLTKPSCTKYFAH